MFWMFEKKVSIKYEILATAVLVMTTWIFFFHWWSTSIFLFMSAILWLYMAINIGANDIPNNIWPAVWAGAINVKWALILAAIFEASWAILAWWDVVNTISKWIINPNQIADSAQFITIMISTLAWAAIWVNLATYFKAPVSPTHSVVWWLIWAWITAVWTSIVNWHLISKIAATWVIAPLMWWVVSVLLLLSIRKNILKKDERWDAAKIWVPIYIWIMVWLFSSYLILKWLHNVLDKSSFDVLLRPAIAIFIWYVLWIITFVLVRIYYKKQSSYFKNSKDFINRLFNIPLLFAVALLSFAHWANDVANAIWPISAINNSIKNHIAAWGTMKIESWIIIIWATWLVLWVTIFGSRLIKTVWNEITKLNQIRAYCVALSAATTAMVAAWLWLPVSLTHITLWWLFGIWLIRQHIKREKWKNKEYIDLSLLKHIALAWVITIPASWIISWITYWIIIKL